jgi:hypothetical protein
MDFEKLDVISDDEYCYFLLQFGDIVCTLVKKIRKNNLDSDSLKFKNSIIAVLIFDTFGYFGCAFLAVDGI